MTNSDLLDRNVSPGESWASMEQKFTFLLPEQERILDWVNHLCVPHPLYHESRICSIYYDTPSFDYFGEKQNSDYLKTKVRLRWYEQLAEVESNPEIKCFLEVKQKEGMIRHKTRLPLTLEAARLRSDPFSDTIVQELPVRVHELSHTPAGFLAPMLLIRYVRYRFIDPMTRFGLAVDTNISCTQVNSRYIAAAHPVHLNNGVLEIKGGSKGLLDSLLPISRVLNQESFSKYARCLEMLMHPLVRRV